MSKVIWLFKALLSQAIREVKETQGAASEILQKLLNYFIHTIYVQHRSYKLKQQMKMAITYDQWEAIALELDHLHEKQKWKQDPRSSHYDYKNTLYLYKFLNELRHKGLTKGLIHTLR